jgi:hypothetical protein
MSKFVYLGYSDQAEAHIYANLDQILGFSVTSFPVLYRHPYTHEIFPSKDLVSDPDDLVEIPGPVLVCKIQGTDGSTPLLVGQSAVA